MMRYAAFKGWDVSRSADLSGYRDFAGVRAYAVRAMQARGYGLRGRTSFHLFRFSSEELRLLLLMVLLGAAPLTACAAGQTAIYYYPSIVLPRMTPWQAVSLASWVLLMFLAVVVPPAKKSRVLGVLVVLSFAASFLAERFLSLSSGTRTIVLTLALSAGAAVLFPHREEEEAQDAA